MQKEVKKLVVSGVILLSVGAASLFWGGLEKEKQKQRLNQQQEFYNSKLVEINKLASSQGEITPYRGIIGDAINSERPDDITQNNHGQAITYFSIGFVVLGVIIFLSLLVLWVIHFFLEKISNFKNNWVQFNKNQEAAVLIESNSQKQKKAELLTQKLYEPAKFDSNVSITDNRKFYPSKPEIENQSIKVVKPDQNNKFFSDKTDLNLTAKPIDHFEDKIRDLIVSSYQENAIKAQDSFKQQADKLEKQVAEIKNLAQSISQVGQDKDKPAENNMVDLAEQISAIRDYASSQQDRMRKLQEGYDWNIIRTFCLRIIRCIDNIDGRIACISQQGGDTCDLEDIKDDLVFALESSGVEQFEPDVNSSYASSQKIAEAVKQRKSCGEPEMAGKIAEIIKPGYRYVIDEENTRVVRIAQVMLFG